MKTRNEMGGQWLVAGCRIAVLIAALLPAWTAAADSKKTTAKEHYARGTSEYNLGNFEKAIAEFEESFRLDAQPVLLFNIAQCHRQLRNNDKAIFFYKRYLASNPKDENRERIEARIRELEELIQRQADIQSRPPAQVMGAGGIEDAQPPTASVSDNAAVPAAAPIPAAAATSPAAITPPAAEPPPPTVAVVKTPSEPSRPGRAGVYVAGAVGIASLATGVFFGLRTRSLSHQVETSTRFNPGDESSALTAQKLEWVFFGVGAAALGVAATLHVLGSREAQHGRSVALAPMLSPSGAGATCRIEF